MHAIACAADTYYLPHCATMLLSALRTNAPLEVNFLHDELVVPTDLNRLRQLVVEHGGVFRAHLVPKAKVEGLPRLYETPAIMWYRIFLPELLPEHERVLYLDCDTLVLGDLSPLWTLQWQGTAVAAVKNILPQEQSSWPAELGVATDAYFNSGVLLMNLAFWREYDCASELVAFGRQQSHRLKWPDQDALNVLFKGRWQMLSPQFNAQNGFWFMPNRSEYFSAAQLRIATRNPVIVHFEGPSLVKPWHVFCKNPYRRLYRQIRASTPWPMRSLQGSELPLARLAWLPAPMLYALLRLKYRLGQWRRRGRR
jgi:lipopolysaccharide biosynthesis glycosyltransferase